MSPSRRNLLLLTFTLLALQSVAAGTSAAPAPPSSAGSSAATSAASSAASSAKSSAATGASSSASSDHSSTSASASASSSASGSSLVATTTSTSPTSSGSQPPLPTLAGVLPPALVVPDTSNAPFMQKSSLPEGTVFICVGAVLGFCGACVLAWRTIVAWSLQRSVRRAADESYASDTKSMFGLGAMSEFSRGGYKSMGYNDSNMSLDQLTNTNTAYGGAAAAPAPDHRRKTAQDRRRSQNPRASRTPTSSTLFFSPTAGTGAANPQASNRSSTFLPAGYYAAGSAAPNAGGAVAHFGGPPAAGYSRMSSHLETPPESPSLRPESRPSSIHLRVDSAGAAQRLSNSRLSPVGLSTQDHRRSRLSQNPSDTTTNAAPTGRTPSAYLEDLFENHGHGPGERF